MSDVCNIGFDLFEQLRKVVVKLFVSVTVFALRIIYKVKIKIVVCIFVSDCKVRGVGIFFSRKNRNLVLLRKFVANRLTVNF